MSHRSSDTDEEQGESKSNNTDTLATVHHILSIVYILQNLS
jgi:hypothetical protein